MSKTLICYRCGTEYSGDTVTCPKDNTGLCDREDLYRVGMKVGQYVIGEILGVGGMGVVYKGRHILLNKHVAIKVLNERYSQRQDSSAEMLREAQAASRIHHPHIVAVTDFGVLSEQAASYIVMEYLEGESLATALSSRRSLAVPRAKKIIRQIASALAAAHKEGIVHRDLKPENVFLLDLKNQTSPAQQAFPVEVPEGEVFVKVLDFGLAKVVDMEPSSRTRAGMLAGTPWYMSPEQAKNAAIDGRSDIYSLGILFYQMVTGVLPFDGGSAVEILMAHCAETPRPPRSHAPHLDEETDRIILRCLQKEPAKRFASMNALIYALDHPQGTIHRESGQWETTPGATSWGSSPAVSAEPLAATRDLPPPAFPFALEESPSAMTQDQSPMPIPSSLGSRSGEQDLRSDEQRSPGLTPIKPTITTEYVERVFGESFTKQPPPDQDADSRAQLVTTGGMSSLPPLSQGTASPLHQREVKPKECSPVFQAPSTAAAANSKALGSRRFIYVGAAGTLVILGLWMVFRLSQGHKPPEQTSTPGEKNPSQSIRITLENLPDNSLLYLDGRRQHHHPFVLPRAEKTHLLVIEADGFPREEHSFVATADHRFVFQKQHIYASTATPLLAAPPLSSGFPKDQPADERLVPDQTIHKPINRSSGARPMPAPNHPLPRSVALARRSKRLVRKGKSSSIEGSIKTANRVNRELLPTNRPKLASGELGSDSHPSGSDKRPMKPEVSPGKSSTKPTGKKKTLSPSSPQYKNWVMDPFSGK